MQEIDQRDREVLSALQEVPFTSTPFAVVGQLIDMSEKEVLKRTERLRREGLLRAISASFDGRSLGYRSSLVAVRAPEEQIDRIASIINLHPGVYQNYRRNHEFNLWFTITVPPGSRLGLEKSVDVLAGESGWTAARLLPTIRHFKGATGDDGESAQHAGDFSEQEIAVVRLLQTDLPIQPRPYDAWSREHGIDTDEIIEVARRLQSRRQLRRFGAITQTSKPFGASAMGVWQVPPEMVDTIAPRMAAHRAVTHCYLRPVYDDWPYNVFTTVQARSVDECEAILSEISRETSIETMKALFPTREYKRSRVVYFSPEIEEWEAAVTARRKSAAS